MSWFCILLLLLPAPYPLMLLRVSAQQTGAWLQIDPKLFGSQCSPHGHIYELDCVTCTSISPSHKWWISLSVPPLLFSPLSHHEAGGAHRCQSGAVGSRVRCGVRSVRLRRYVTVWLWQTEIINRGEKKKSYLFRVCYFIISPPAAVPLSSPIPVCLYSREWGAQ